MKKILIHAALALTASIPALSQAAVINFATLYATHRQDSVVDGSTWASLGIVFSSPQGLVAACGGSCLTAGARSYYGQVDGAFFLPNTRTSATVTSLAITGITGSSKTQLFDISNNVIGTYTSSFSYSGTVGVARFSSIQNYDGFGSMSFDNLTAAAVNVAKVPEPASLILVGLGFMGLAAARRRKH